MLVTFIPLNDRVEKQAFGRTGRKGATGSCQIIVNREAMPEWARQCETVDEVKRLRDSIEMHRLNNVTEVNLMRNKHKLFREYCVFKTNFDSSSICESDDLEIQKEILDVTWANWIQEYETMNHESNHSEMVQELHRILTDCSKQAKEFDSDNIYHILKFGGVRLRKGDFERASKFYDQVIRKDSAWSAFAHYNRAFCTVQLKGDGYIRHAIDDLNAAICHLEKYKTNCLLSDIFGRVNRGHVMNCTPIDDQSKQYYVMMECQLLHYLETQMSECIDKLETIDIKKEEVTTVRRNILDSIPDADCRTEQMLQKYQQLGLLFTYNIGVEPQFCYRNQAVSSLCLVVLESMADIIFLGISNGILVNGRSMKLKNNIDAACSMEAIGDESLMWMSRCVSKAIITEINSINFIRDFSWLVHIKETELESSYKMTKETSQFKQFANLQARHICKLIDPWKEEMKNLISCQVDEILMHMTNVTMSDLREPIEQTIHNKFARGDLRRQLCSVYDNLTSPSSSDLEQFVNFIRDLEKISGTIKLCDAEFQTGGLARIAVELISKSRNGGITATDLVRSYTHEIETAAAKIEIKNVITKFSVHLCAMMIRFIQKSTTDGYVCGEVRMLKATNESLTLACSDAIRGMLQTRIIRSVMLDTQRRTNALFQSMMFKFKFNFIQVQWVQAQTSMRGTKQCKPLPSRLKEYNNRMKKSRGPHVPSKTDARMISKHDECNIIILDVNREEILTIVSPDIRESIELIYNPPCPRYPEGHFDSNVEGNVKKHDASVGFYYDMQNAFRIPEAKLVEAPNSDYDDNDILCSAIKDAVGRAFTNACKNKKIVENYIDANPSNAGMILIRDEYGYQMKRGRALLRLDSNHPTRQMNQHEYVELDSSQFSSCIEQALMSENVSQLAKILAEYESELRSGIISTEHGIETMMSPLSRDACKLFRFSGSSVEAEIYRQLVVERINDGDITTALKLCCIGHQIPFCKDRMMNGDLPLSDTFKHMLKMNHTNKRDLHFCRSAMNGTKFLNLED